MSRCQHCSSLTVHQAEFCCNGCRVAYEIMSSLNLLQYYKFCAEVYRSSPKAVSNMINEVDYNEYATFTELDGHESGKVDLIIEGMHCGSCVWLIENALKKQPGIVEARINLSTKRLHLIWKVSSSSQKKAGANTAIIDGNFNLNQIVNLIHSLGYKATPFIENKNHEQQQNQQRYLLKCIIIAAVVWVQNMMISMGIWADNWTNDMGGYSRFMMNAIAGAVTIPCIYYASLPFFRSAVAAIRHRSSNMDVPISIAIVSTLLISAQETVLNSSMTYYEAVSALVFALLVSRYLDLKVRNSAYQSVQTLLSSQVMVASVLNDDGSIRLVHSHRIELGDIIVVQNGERIAVDGVIIEGEALIDNSIITGESIPQKFKQKDYVYAGSLNLGGNIKIKVEKQAKNTILSEIIDLMEDAEQHKTKYRTIADKVARWYTPVVLGAGALTFALWLYCGAQATESILHAVSVLIITCPCALGLAVPAVQIAAVSRLINHGIILKRGDTLERIANFDMVAFDKTGTLTVGQPQWVNFDTLDKEEKQLVFGLALHSKHHICQAIISFLENDEVVEFDEIHEEQGEGVEGVYIENSTITDNLFLAPILKSSPNLLQISAPCFEDSIDSSVAVGLEKNITPSKRMVTVRLGKYDWCMRDLWEKIDKTNINEESFSNKNQDSYTINSWLVIIDDHQDKTYSSIKVCCLKFADTLKPEAYDLVKYIKTKTCRIVLLSGDNDSNVSYIANLLGIEEYYSNATPKQKYDIICQWQQHHKVFMVGDGLNDAAALKAAHVSASPATAMVIAHNQADVIWQGDLGSIQLMIETATKSMRLMKQNFALSLLYNIVAVPFAVLGCATPIVAAIFMGLSSILVVLNAMRIR